MGIGARLVGHVVGSCIMVAPAYASDTSGLDFQQFVEEFAEKDFFVALASATLSVAGTAVAVAHWIKQSALLMKQSARRSRHSKLLQKAKSNKRWQRPWSLLNPAGRKTRSSKGQ